MNTFFDEGDGFNTFMAPLVRLRQKNSRRQLCIKS